MSETERQDFIAKRSQRVEERRKVRVYYLEGLGSDRQTDRFL